MVIQYFCDLDTVHLDGNEVDCHSATLTIKNSGPNRQSWTVEFLRANLNDRLGEHRPVRITMTANNGQVMRGVAILDSTSSFRGVGQLEEWPDIALAG